MLTQNLANPRVLKRPCADGVRLQELHGGICHGLSIRSAAEQNYVTKLSVPSAIPVHQP
jgi:hypothetical protein